MGNWFKEEIDQLGGHLTEAIEKASGEIQLIVKQAANEVNQQRHLTIQDVQTLINYASNEIDEKLQRRIRQLQITILGSVMLFGVFGVAIAWMIAKRF